MTCNTHIIVVSDLLHSNCFQPEVGIGIHLRHGLPSRNFPIVFTLSDSPARDAEGAPSYRLVIKLLTFRLATVRHLHISAG